MRAVICRQYGPPDKLKIEEIPIPSPGSDELLIKVHATTINNLDWSLVTGIDAAGKLERMKSLGFNQVYDYQKFHFTESGEQYDLILDAKTTYSPSKLAKALKPEGKY